MNYATAGAPSGSDTATTGTDYVQVASTQIAFATGSSFAYARVLINGDELNEPDETLLVNLSAPLNATIAKNQATGTIVNDDRMPSLIINDVSISEGNSGTKMLDFTVTLSHLSGQSITVNYATADGTGRSTNDYGAAIGTLTFAPNGALTRTIRVPIIGDTVLESDETFSVLLSGALNATIGRGRGIGTILNDEHSTTEG